MSKFPCKVIGSILYCRAVSLQEQLEHIIKRRQESSGYNDIPTRRLLKRDDYVLGVPTRLSHLPPSEPILPGHTLLRPAFEMLKSSIKFPHKELENGAGVYGNYDNWGLRYDGRNERVLYSGFRRMPSDYIMVVPTKEKTSKPKFTLTALSLDNQEETKRNVLEFLKRLQSPKRTRNSKIYAIPGINGKTQKTHKDTSIYLNPRSIKKLITEIDLYEKDSNVMNGLHSSEENIFIDSDPEVFRRHNITLLSKSNGVIYHEDEISNDDDNKAHKLPDPIPISKEENKEDKHKKWFWNSKSMFDNIKINDEAPSYSDLVPASEPVEDLKQWWYFNQEDHKSSDES